MATGGGGGGGAAVTGGGGAAEPTAGGGGGTGRAIGAPITVVVEGSKPTHLAYLVAKLSNPEKVIKHSFVVELNLFGLLGAS